MYGRAPPILSGHEAVNLTGGPLNLDHPIRFVKEEQQGIVHARNRAIEESLESPYLAFIDVDEPAPTIHLPMERPLYSPPVKPLIAGEVLTGDEAQIAADALFDQIIVDKARLQANIRRLLTGRNQVTLRRVIFEHPLQHGLAEVVAYLSIAADDPNAVFDENAPEYVSWPDGQGRDRVASLPRVIFNRP